LSAISMPITDENKTILATIGTTFPTAELEPSKDRFIEALKQTVEAVMAKFTN
jgi:DNA-binding IclR family transcriptional regulator